MAAAPDVGAEAQDAYTIREAEDRSAKLKNWARRSNSSQMTAAQKQWHMIRQAYDNMQLYAEDCGSYWNIYNCKSDENQTYTGGYSTVYIPIVRDCVEARKKRALSHLFPLNDRHVEAISSDGQNPDATASLLEHHINNMDLRTKIGSMIVQGDVTGQWCLYVDWAKDRKRITKMVNAAPDIDDEPIDPTIEFQDIKDDEFITEEGPDVWIPNSTDIAVIPPTVDDLKEAQIVVIRHRMSKAKVNDFIDRDIFVGASTDELMRKFESRIKDRNKKQLEDMGIRTEGTDKYAEIFEAHLRMRLDHEDKEQAVVWYRGDGKVLGIIRNPLWSKRIPIISAPVNKIAGSFYGRSQIAAVKFLQWQANDIANIGQDAAIYALNPIIMTDPEKNPQYQSMVISMAAVWPVDPASTRILEFPQMWAQSQQIVATLKGQIRESMNVTDYELGQAPQGRKNNAQIGALGQTMQMGSNDMSKDIENRILNPLLEMMFELDTQFRSEETTILVMGDVGVRAHMERVPPQQFSAKYFFRWVGTDYIASVQRIQQMIAAMNVMRGLPPQAMNGKRLDVMPIVEHITEVVFGSRLAPKIIIDERQNLSVPVDIENDMLHNGMHIETHPMDNDVDHLRAHGELAKTTGDPSGHIRVHMLRHMKQLQAKSMQAQQQMAPKNPALAPGQGMPGGAGPGVPGTPRPGAVPAAPRPQGPPGMIHQDQMQSPEAGRG